jgi:phosphate transport system substrate-binding protein
MEKPGLENLRRARLDLLRAGVFALLALATGVNSWTTARAEEIKIGGTGGALGAIQQLAEAYNESRSDTKAVIVPNLGSSGGIKAVISGAIQLGVSSRPLRESETSHGAKAIEYARTPFVFATSGKTSGAPALTLQQVVEIYAGKMERWPDGTKIRLVLRPESDSDTEMLRKISPAMMKAEMLAQKRPGMLIGGTDHDAAEHLERLSGSIGTTTLALILSEKRSLKALKVNGVEPTAKSIADGTYPYYKPMLLVTGPKTPPSAQKFIEFVQSPTGRAILSSTGHWVK